MTFYIAAWALCGDTCNALVDETTRQGQLSRCRCKRRFKIHSFEVFEGVGDNGIDGTYIAPT